MFSDRVWGVGRNPNNLHAEFLGVIQVDIVEACTTQSNELHTLFCQKLQARSVKAVIDKDTDALSTISRSSSIGMQPTFMKLKLCPMSEVLSVVGLGIVEAAL